MVDFCHAVEQHLFLIVLLAEEVDLKERMAEREREKENGSYLIHLQKKKQRP